MVTTDTLYRVAITGNKGNDRGGGVYTLDSNIDLLNITIAANMSDFGGGMFIKDSDIMFVNSILWGNDEFQAAFGYVDALSHVTLYASVIQDGGMGIYNEQLYGIFSGDPPITESPLFIIPLYPDEDDEPTIFGVFHLLSISPCIDAGNSDTPLDPDGTIADIGAYYFDQDGSVDDLPGFIFGDYNYGVNPIPNFDNIMEALEYALSEGLDTIIVTPGLYTGHIEITSAVTLTSFYSFDPYPGHVNSTILDRGIVDNII